MLRSAISRINIGSGGSCVVENQFPTLNFFQTQYVENGRFPILVILCIKMNNINNWGLYKHTTVSMMMMMPY